MRALLPRVAAALRSASWIADGVLGAHGYQNYLAHQRVHGHGEPPLTEREFWKAAIENNEADDAALDRGISLMTRYGAIADTVLRARHFGDIARDALGPLKSTPQKAALLDVIDFCISRET